MVTPADHSAPSASLSVLAEEVVLPVVIFLKEGCFAMVARGWEVDSVTLHGSLGRACLAGGWIDDLVARRAQSLTISGGAGLQV